MPATEQDLDAEEKVVLVNELDHPLGVAPKLAVHRAPGALHRAVSACLFDRSGRVLAQRRALGKYHFPGVWANACCTHPRPGELPALAVERRLVEELGLVATRLRPAGTFIYRAVDPASGLVEHELDHVFTGVVDGPLAPAPREVMDIDFLEADEVLGVDATTGFTPWFGGVLRVALAPPAPASL